MDARKIRQFGQVAVAGLGLMLASTPAFAQEGGGLNLVELFSQMGAVAMAVAIVLFVMSFWSVGVAIERIFTYNKAKAQSKLYAPQVAKQRMKTVLGLHKLTIFDPSGHGRAGSTGSAAALLNIPPAART